MDHVGALTKDGVILSDTIISVFRLVLPSTATKNWTKENAWMFSYTSFNIYSKKLKGIEILEPSCIRTLANNLLLERESIKGLILTFSMK